MPALPPTPPPLTEDEARAVWRRAAELHLATAHPPAVVDDRRAPGTVTLDAVREAAEGAGIAPEFVERALGELHERTPEAGADPRSAFERRLGRLLLGAQPEHLAVQRPLPVPLAAAGDDAVAVLAAAPFGLVRPRLLGAPRPDRTTLALDLPLDEELKHTQGKRERAAVAESWEALRTHLYTTEVRLVLQRAPRASGVRSTDADGAEAGCTLTLGVDLRPGLARATRAQALVVGTATLLAALVGGGVLGILLHEAGGMAGIPALALGVAVAAVLTLLLGSVATRLLALGTASHATQELARAADAVLARVSEEALAPRR